MDLFAHRIHRATYVNGVVRLECSIVHPDKDGNYHPEKPVEPRDVTFAVHLPLQGFMRSMAQMRELVGTLQEEGVLKKGEGQGEGGGERGGPQRRLRDLSEDERGGGGSDQIV